MFHCKKNLFITLFAIAFSPIVLFAQKPDGYTITGRVNGLREGDKVLMNMMVYNPGEAIEVHRDSGFVKNGEFRIEGHVPDGPRIYWMRFPRLGRLYRMFIDNNQDMTVRFDNDLAKVRFELVDRILRCDGSPTNDAFHLIWAVDDMYAQSNGMIGHDLDKVRDSLGYNRNIVSGLMRAKKAVRDALNVRFLNHMEPIFLPGAALFAMYESGDHDAVWADVFDQMDDHLRNSVPGKMLQTRLSILVGNQMPDFNLPDDKGNSVHLGDLTAKSKLTLVRFWASNSYNRQAFDQELKAMYQKYHDKGLNVVAVSTDSTSSNWMQALQTEHYPWLNVIDLRGKSVVDPVYHELGSLSGPNTTNVLLNKEGKIVAWDVYGLELRWYLDNMLDPDSSSKIE